MVFTVFVLVLLRLCSSWTVCRTYMYNNMYLCILYVFILAAHRIALQGIKLKLKSTKLNPNTSVNKRPLLTILWWRDFHNPPQLEKEDYRQTHGPLTNVSWAELLCVRVLGEPWGSQHGLPCGTVHIATHQHTSFSILDVPDVLTNSILCASVLFIKRCKGINMVSANGWN